MKLFQAILVTLTLSFVSGYKVFKDSVVAGDVCLRYTRSVLLNEALSKRIPERHVALFQRIKNKNIQQLRAAFAELLKETSAMKQVPGRKSKQKSNEKIGSTDSKNFTIEMKLFNRL